MPEVTLHLSRPEYTLLKNRFAQDSTTAPLPTFEQWLIRTAIEQAAGAGQQDDIRHFKIIEGLITGLQQCGYQLVQTGPDRSAERATLDLSVKLASEFDGPEFYVRRIHELLDYYQKLSHDVTASARDAAAGAIGATLHDAWLTLLQRTGRNSLSGERAIGRVEGAAAMLVSAGVLDRRAAQEHTDAYKAAIRTNKKSSWVGKVFGGADDQH